MEFLEGESLRQALARRGALPVTEVAEILQQAARGLNAAHRLGIIRRDLKPGNIFLTYPDEDVLATVSPPTQVEASVAQAAAFAVCGSSLHSRSRTWATSLAPRPIRGRFGFSMLNGPSADG
jgi:serine/threonine protein kinase